MDGGNRALDQLLSREASFRVLVFRSCSNLLVVALRQHAAVSTAASECPAPHACLATTIVQIEKLAGIDYISFSSALDR